MNPKMVRSIVQAMIALAKMGVQIFVTTHDYFVQQEFNMLKVYPELCPDNLDIRFLSLYRDESQELKCEMEPTASDLRNNAIMQEFDAMYDREQRGIYGNWRKNQKAWISSSVEKNSGKESKECGVRAAI